MLSDGVRKADYINTFLGAHALRAKLNKTGMTNEKIKEQHLAFMEAPELVIHFMGGQEVYEMLPPDWREPMLALSALRMLAEEAGCDFTPDYPHRPDVVGIYREEH